MFFFFFKQKTAYEMRISDWSSDVCSSDLPARPEIDELDMLQRPFAFRRHHHARSEEHTSELQSLMRISYAVFCLKKKKHENKTNEDTKSNKTKNKQNKKRSDYRQSKKRQQKKTPQTRTSNITTL